MNFKEDILKQIKETFEGVIDVQYIERDFVLGQTPREKAIKAVYELAEEGELIFSAKNKFVLSEKLELFKGKVIGNQKGFAFLEPDDKTKDDYFILPRDLNGAFHGDIVLAKEKELEKKKGAFVYKILKRGVKTLVGTFIESKNCGFVRPDDRHFSEDVFIPKNSTKLAVNGEKVYVEITDYEGERGKWEGKVLEILGTVGQKGVDILSVIRGKNLFESFSNDVMREALAIPKTVEENNFKNRKAFFDDNIITIDGEDARDLDDAISIKKEGKGYKLFVHIADVAEYVKEDTKLDEEAFMRGTSVYFPDRVLPMLPPALSNGICSLNEKVARLCLTAEMNFNENGEFKAGKVYESIIKSKARMTYSSVTKILDGDEEEAKKYAFIKNDLTIMAELALKLEKLRTQRGAIDFDIPEAYIIVDENGKTTDIVKRPRELSHRIIESFMIAANEFIAEKFFRDEVPFVYRVHEKPDLLRVETFCEFVSGFGEMFKVKDELHSKDLQKFLNQIAGKPYENTFNKLALRTMQKAKYSEMCMGHYGLASVYYCHFTSPIRRYPDLAIHRIIKKTLHGKISNEELVKLEEFVELAAIQSSSREKLAEEAEREVDDMKKAEYMQKFIGEEFDGVVSGVTNFGVFIELENTIEGLIRIDSLPKDNYVFYDKKIMLKGAQKTYRLGDAIRIIVVSADPNNKKIDFAEVKKENNIEKFMEKNKKNNKI